MKSKLLISLFFIFIIFQVRAQIKSVTGDWLLTMIETDQTSDQAYIVNHFDANGSVSISGTKIADFTQRNQNIDFKSERFKIYNGQFHILKQSLKELALGGNKATLYFKRAYDRRQINPVYQNLIGTWLMRGNVPTYVRFEDKGKFVMSNLEENGTVTTKGSWLFIPDEKAFVVLADVDVLRRKDSILQINNDYMEVLNNGIQYQLEKQPEVLAIKHLQIDEKTLTEPTDGQSGLPWNNDDLWMFLPKLKNLRYICSVYHPEVKTFSKDYISVDVLIDTKKKNIKFDSYKEIDEERVPFTKKIKGLLMETYNRFFPQKDLEQYSIIDRNRPWKLGNKTYECTIVNGIIGDEQYQYWMINNMPGVYAKIIIEIPETKEYSQYALSEISYNN